MPKSFYIIDGHAQIFRSYFAPFRDLVSPAGEPTKATFVFTQMLMNLVEHRKPDFLAMTLDSGDESVFRKEIFPEYKSNRKAPPDDFAPQAKRIIQIVQDVGVPLFVKPGYEADDLIATMVRELSGQDYEIFIVSVDKDLRQLITERTKMYDVQKDQVIDAAAMIEKSGYSPAQAIDVQTLMGDAVDNVQGIPGVGEKTAAKLINQYGSADAVLEHVDELTPKMRENFQTYADRIPIARQLVTLKDDVDFGFDPAKCAFTGLNQDVLRQYLESLGFHSLLKRIDGDKGSAGAPVKSGKRGKTIAGEQGLFGAIEPPSAASLAPLDGTPAETSEHCDYSLVDSAESLKAFLDEVKRVKRFAFDTETDALGAMCSNIVGMSFSWKHGTGHYIPLRGPDGWKGPTGFAGDWKAHVLSAIKPILEDESIKKVGHNIKYDILVMRREGIELSGLSMDSMVAAFLVDSVRFRYGIDKLALDLLHFRKIATSELIGSGKKQISMDRIPLARIAHYASEDADIALRLADYYQEKLDALPVIKKLHDELETPLVFVLAEMEFNGVAIDPAILKAQSVVLGQRIDALREKLLASAGCEFNPDSPKQLGDVLFNKLGLTVVKKTKTGPSTDVEVLEKLADVHETPRLMLEYRSLQKLKNTYLDNLPRDINPRTGRIHGSFNQTGASTGRLSMSDPNLQQIPIREEEGRLIRTAFVAGDPEHNVLIAADYSQIELRILAHFTQEPALLRAFEQDEDIHRAVAAEVFNVPLADVTREQRGQAKIINFGIIYGVTAYGLAKRIDGLDVPAAGELIAAYNRRFPSIQTFMDRCVMTAKTQGYVETILGRRRYIPDINSGVLSINRAAERVAINSVVQGSAADLIKVAMLNIYRKLRDEKRPSKMLLQVHDELVFETPIVAAEDESGMIRDEMVNAMKLSVPLKVEVHAAASWGEAK